MKTISLVRIPSLVGLCFAAAVATNPLHAVVTFSLTDVGDPNIPSYVTPYLPTINNSGQVAYTLISTFPDYSGYFYSSGTLTRIPTLDDNHDLPGHDNFAFDLNDSGYIVGESRINNSSDTSHAYFSPSATSSTDINPGVHDNYSSASVINNNGLVLGSQHTSMGGTLPRFLYSIPSSTTTNLSALLPAGANAIDLNNLNHVLGTVGGTTFVYDGAVHTLAGFVGSAVDLNDVGQVAAKGTTDAMLYSGGSSIILGSFAHSFTVDALNNLGTVVGSYALSAVPPPYPDSGYRAYASFGSGIVDLNTVIDPTLGWTLLTANDVNDLGQITGVAITPTGDLHPYILTPLSSPVPESSTYGAIAGVISLALVALRFNRDRGRKLAS